MTLEQLRIFVAVAERQHVTRAADALNLSQSAVSAAVSAIEGRHATKLFHRVGRGIALTEAGRVFLGEAQAVLARAAMAETALADLSDLRRGTLTIRASQTIAGYWLPRHLVAFHRAHPAIEIVLGVGNTAEAAAAVHDGRAELGFVEGGVDDPALAVSRIGEDRLVLVVSPDHPFATGREVDLAALGDAEWVLREVGSGTRSAFEAAVGDAGLPASALRVALELPSNEAVRAAVEAGAGATVISESVVAAALQAGSLCQVAYPLPSRAYAVLRHEERYRSRASDALLALIAAACP